jgi:hypothetical protein
MIIDIQIEQYLCINQFNIIHSFYYFCFELKLYKYLLNGYQEKANGAENLKTH